MASTTQLPDNPHDLAERLAQAAKLKDAEIVDPPSRTYARVRDPEVGTLGYVMCPGRQQEGEGSGAPTWELKEDQPIAIHTDTGDGGKIHRASSLSEGASILNDARRAKAQAKE